MDQYLLGGELPGVACAAGTMTARLNNLQVIVAAYAEREPNPRDRFELSSLASSLAWLNTDDWISRGFADISLVIPQTAFAANHPEIAKSGPMEYRDAIAMLRKALVEVVLEGNPVALSA